MHDDALSKLLQIVICHVFHDLRDKDTFPGQNLPNTSPGSAPVQANRLKLSGYLQKKYFEKSKKSFNALAVVVPEIFAKEPEGWMKFAPTTNRVKKFSLFVSILRPPLDKYKLLTLISFGSLTLSS